MPCPLCQDQSAIRPPPITFTHDVECPNCGSFRITDQAVRSLHGQDAVAFDIASWVYGQTQLGGNPKIDEPTIARIKTYPRPTIKKRAELYLGRVIRMLEHKLSGKFISKDARLRVASWTQCENDAEALAGYLNEVGALKETKHIGQYMLVPNGHIIYDEMTFRRIDFPQVFVAMWFDEEMNDAYNKGIYRAVIDSGYTPLRIDRKEHAERIDDALIAEIRRSAFVVADCTKNRPNVYYEAGFAHGLGRRVIFTCRNADRNGVHFDVRQYNTISWSTPEELVAPLQNRILALFGAGPDKPDAKPIALA